MTAILITLVTAALASLTATYLLSHVFYAVARYGVIFTSLDRRSTASSAQALSSSSQRHIYSFILIILYMLLGSFIIDAKFTWATQAIIGGLGSAALLLHEAATTQKRPLVKLCFYISGFILTFEVLIFLAAVVGG